MLCLVPEKTMALPSFIALASNSTGSYLRYMSRGSEAPFFLKFSGEELVSVYTKFQVEKAKTGNGSFVHIRSVYNNKYWVREGDDRRWIQANADEPNEDVSDWSCTLFEAFHVDDDNSNSLIRLRHVQLGRYVSLWRLNPTPHLNLCLFAGTEEYNPSGDDILKVTDFDTLFVLPKHIAIRGFHGGYLTGKVIEEKQFLQFLDTDIKDPTVWYEAFLNNKDGTVALKSKYFAKFCRRSPDENWVLADTEAPADENPDKDSLFWPTPVEKTTISIRNLGNNSYCKRLSVPEKASCLSADDSTITSEAKLNLEETVESRSIYDVEYQISDARCYGQRDVVSKSFVLVNDKDIPETEVLDISYTDSVAKAWNSSISQKIFSQVNIDAKNPKVISTGHTEFNSRISELYKWGETIKTETQINISYTVTIPPKSTVTVTVKETETSTDIPFKYTQKDTLVDGNEIVYKFDDGLFTGTNVSHSVTDEEVEPLA